MATDFQVYKILQRTTIISGCNIVIFLKNNCFASFYLHFTLHALRMVKMKEKPAPGASAGHLSRKQTRSFIDKLVDSEMLSSEGEGKGRTYSLSKKYEMEMSLINEAVKIRLKEMSKTKGRKNG